MSSLISLLPDYERNSNVFKEYLKAIETEFNEKDIDLDELRNQLSISTATWALSIYENALNIKTDSNLSYDERRSVIKGKYRGSGKVDSELIKIVVDSFNVGETSITFDGNIKIKIEGSKGKPDNYNLIENAVDEIKPAHIQALFLFSYYTLLEIESMSITEVNNIPIKHLAFTGG